jgi:hypothetical protein
VPTDLRKMVLSRGRDRARNREAWRRFSEEASAHSGLLRHLEGRKERNLIRKIWVYLGMLPKVILWIFKFVTKLHSPCLLDETCSPQTALNRAFVNIALLIHNSLADLLLWL